LLEAAKPLIHEQITGRSMDPVEDL
jgi:hypothetical protein